MPITGSTAEELNANNGSCLSLRYASRSSFSLPASSKVAVTHTHLSAC